MKKCLEDRESMKRERAFGIMRQKGTSHGALDGADT
jgi:hypothetical protein